MENNKQQTAVEWLYNELLNSEPNILEWNKLLEQAKEIEKEQIIEGYAHGHDDGWGLANNKKQEFIHARQYYEQTYGGNK